MNVKTKLNVLTVEVSIIVTKNIKENQKVKECPTNIFFLNDMIINE